VTALGALWIVLARGELSSFAFGLPFIVVAAFLAGRQVPISGRRRLMPAVRLAVFFLGRCMVAGIDVARRAFGPRDAIRPGLVDYRFTVARGAPRALLASIVTLLPGTMSTAIEGDLLRLHVLDTRLDVVGEVAGIELLLAAVFPNRPVDRRSHGGGEQ
jgi:multicomponent Na+:H+ antiporter subunit E